MFTYWIEKYYTVEYEQKRGSKESFASFALKQKVQYTWKKFNPRKQWNITKSSKDDYIMVLYPVKLSKLKVTI